MAHKKLLETLDQCLKDFRGNSEPFGSTLILLAGDFKQTLPIIPRSTPADEMNACLKNFNLWLHVKTLKLTTNMRVRLQAMTLVKYFQINCWQLETESSQ